MFIFKVIGRIKNISKRIGKRTIASLAQIMAKIVGFTGRLVFDTSKPDGTPRKLLDVLCLK